MGRFCLRFQSIDVNLGNDDFIAGRVPECDLVLDDALVSRKHASFRVAGDAVEVRDLDSRNGVSLNGARIDKLALARHGDRVRIGSQELLIKGVDRARSAAGTVEMVLCQGCGGMSSAMQSACHLCGRAFPLPSNPAAAADEARSLVDDAATRTEAPFHALTQLADKALGLGRLDEAERILGNMLGSVRLRASAAAGSETDRDELASAARYALRLADAMQKSAWLDYPFELYTATGQLMPVDLIDDLYRVAEKVRYTNARAVRAYLARLRSDGAQLGPTDRFLMLRLEGLERRVVSA